MMSPIDQAAAGRAGMSIRVYRLQQQLRRLPVQPNSARLKKQRERILKLLIQAARQDGCLPKITPWAGSDF